MIRTAARTADISELVRSANRGDDRAFARLVDLYKDRIYSYVARMLHDPTEAEDVAQEAFIRAFENMAGFREASSFQTWLYRIASNLAIDASRARKRRGVADLSLDKPMATDDGEVERELPTEGRGPEDVAESAELQEMVAAGIAQLSPKLRAVMTLYDLAGLSYSEIAKILGCPVGTVKSRLFNARNQLRAILEDKLDVQGLPAE